jgi:hypothetical protein
MNRVSVLAPFFQRNPTPDFPQTGIVRSSRIPAIRGLHLEELDSNPMPGKEVHARLWTVGDEGEMAFMDQGRNGADAYFDMCRPRYEKLHAMGIHHVSGPNEPLFWNLDQLRRYNAFQVRLADRVGQFGMHYWGWDWSVGWPDHGLADLWVDSVRAARQTGGGLVVHMYGSPKVFRNDQYGLPDEHYALRVNRQIKELYQAGLEDGERWIILGECGIDGGIVPWWKHPWNQTRSRRGWREWVGWELPLNEQIYWNQLSEYDDVLVGIKEIRWAFPFIALPNPDWNDFEITEFHLRQMAARYDRITIGEHIQQFVIPSNPVAALERAALTINPGAVAVSPEVDHNGRRGQAFRFPGDSQWQHILHCKIGDWGNITYERRRN